MVTKAAVAQKSLDQALQGRGPEKGGRAAAQVNFADKGWLRPVAAVFFPFLEDGIDVGIFQEVVFGDVLIAAAVGAELLAVGKVYVKA
jgi:hypothetical protein